MGSKIEWFNRQLTKCEVLLLDSSCQSPSQVNNRRVFFKQNGRSLNVVFSAETVLHTKLLDTFHEEIFQTARVSMQQQYNLETSF